MELLNDEFAPVTMSIGLIHLPLRAVAEFVVAWHKSIGVTIRDEPLRGPLPELLSACLPLTFPETKKLLVGASDGQWTAVFLNAADVPTPSSVVAYVCREIHTDGVVVTCSPTTYGVDGKQVLHQVTRFEKIATSSAEYLNYERVIEVAEEDGRWTFELAGREQSFERPDAYRCRSVRQRFTPEILQDYCAAVGVYPFLESFYDAEAHLIESLNVPVQRQGDYADVQASLGMIR